MLAYQPVDRGVEIVLVNGLSGLCCWQLGFQLGFMLVGCVAGWLASRMRACLYALLKGYPDG